jgi:uncharacterized protein YciI
MPKWTEYKASAKERGALALELYMVRSTPVGDVPLLQKTLPAHLEYQAGMEKAGKLVLAGPLSDPTGEQMFGEGLIIYRANSLEQAREYAEADPMHAAGARTFDIRRWLINEGNLTLNVNLSLQNVSLD